MARQVLPIVGAVAGFVISGGNPYGAQVGFALGSLVGNAVDPIEMQGRKLGDAPTQVAAEGGARAIVYGKGCIRATVVLERGGRRVIRQRDSSGGKGGGPTTINERALWTFAIGLGEPVAAILRIWENEKLVYDVTPGSTIQDDTAQFAEKFRFYTGAEDQLPDPALEALHGDDTPYYRGTAYMVFPQYDLTDFGETVPTYRVEVATLTERAEIVTVLALGYTGASIPRSAGSVNGTTWPVTTNMRPVNTAIYLAATGERFITWNITTAYYTDDQGATWNTSSGGLGGNGGPRFGDAKGDLVLISGGLGEEVRRSLDAGASFSPVAGSPGVAYLAIGSSGVCGVTISGQAYTSDAMGSSWAGPYATGVTTSSGQAALEADDDSYYLGGTIAGAAALAISSGGVSWSVATLPVVSATQVRCIATGTIGDDHIVVAGANNGEIYYRVNGGAFQLASDSLGAQCNSVVFNGERFIMGGGSSADGVIKHSVDGDSWTPSTQPFAYYVERLAAAEPGIPEQSADPIPLSDIIAALHDRAGHTSADYDVAELSELSDGVVIESTVTGAEAINSIIGCHFADPSDYDGQIHYIKRGKPVQLTLTEDALIDEPEVAQRNNSIEYPKKVHFLGQRADLAYASSKSTSSRYSSDAQVVGEVTVGSPETFDDGIQPAEIAVKLHKVLWEEAIGEQELTIPDNFLGLVPTDCVGFAYRDQLNRYRILNIEDTPGQRKLRMIKDRQSAYTANLTEIPNPPPVTPPQSSVVAPTIMAFIDTSALTDNADTLHYLVALSGANDNWAGAVLQQQIGGSFNSIDSTTLNSIMGVVQNDVADASPYYTDTTNTVTVRLYTDDELESRTDAEFLSNGGAFFLSSEDSGETVWEIMQFRDAVQDSNGDWVLSHLMRGRKNTPTNEHPVGSTFVWIDPSILRESAQSSWIDTELTHRAVSNGQSPELATVQTNEYVGNSQREWPVANLLLSRPTGTSVLAEAIPRHRFGSSMNPIRSINWDGYQWTATDGANTINRTGTSATETFDTTGWATPVTVTVSQLNRITGAGPSVSEVIV